MVTDEVVVDLYVLGLVVLNRIMSDLDGTLIVTQVAPCQSKYHNPP
jgi:hypothetical protein